MAKARPQQNQPFTARDLGHALARGIHKAFSAIEEAASAGRQIAEEVWNWVTTQSKNARAMQLLEQHRPDLASLAAA